MGKIGLFLLVGLVKRWQIPLAINSIVGRLNRYLSNNSLSVMVSKGLLFIGDHLGVSESATGRACRKVCRAIWRIFSHVIRFPDGERAQQVQEGFRRIAGTFSYLISMNT
jgi:hypothetical protein